MPDYANANTGRRRTRWPAGWLTRSAKLGPPNLDSGRPAANDNSMMSAQGYIWAPLLADVLGISGRLRWPLGRAKFKISARMRRPRAQWRPLLLLPKLSLSLSISPRDLIKRRKVYFVGLQLICERPVSRGWRLKVGSAARRASWPHRSSMKNAAN